MKSARYDAILWQNRQNRRMKNKLRHLTAPTLVLALAVVAYLLAEPIINDWRAASQQGKPTQPEETAPDVGLRRVLAENIQVDASGDHQILLAIARLEQRSSVTARILHQANIHGIHLGGKGEYLQSERGTHRHVRWLLESQHDGVRTSFLQSSDGRFLWTDRQVATGRRIQRVDLWQLRRMSKLDLSDDSEGRSTESAPFSPQLTAGYGGLPMLLESLRAHFEFTRPRVFRAPESLGLGSQPVLGMIGRWRPESLAVVVADLSQIDESLLAPATMTKQLEQRLANGPLPAQLPINVLVLLGQNDLFPYLIEYRAIDDVLASADLASESLFQLSRAPLTKLEFFDVVFDREIDGGEFLYSAPDEPAWYDGTDQYVDRMRHIRTIRLAQQRGRQLATAPSDPLH